jgi:hypothetical protein
MAMVASVDRGAERIVDDFLADEDPEDLLQLQRAIADAMGQAYEGGMKGNRQGQASK